MSRPAASTDTPSILPALQRAAQRVQQGEFVQAEGAFREILKQHPDHPETLHQLGLLYHRMGKYTQAESCLRKAATGGGGNAAYCNNLGVVLRAAGKNEDAMEAYRQAIALQPGLADSYYNLGNALSDLARDAEAAGEYEKALALRPDYPAASYYLGLARLRLRDYEPAIRRLREVIARTPQMAEAYMHLGMALEAIGGTAEAIKCHGQAVALAPALTESHYALGVLARAQGDMDAAEGHFRRVLELQPNHAGAYRFLAVIKKYNDKDIAEIERLLKRTSTSDEDRSYLHFALGKIAGDRKEYDDSFAHYAEGNALHRKSFTPDRAKYTRFFTQLMDTYTPEFFAAHKGWGSDSDYPIFIVGMPRSGTTLTEQILASHSQVFGGGELYYFNNLHLRLPTLLHSTHPYPRCMAEMTPDAAKALAAEYVAALQGRAGGKAHASDKMPSNFQNLGLMALLFPRAKFIHCRRHPLDNGLSIFFQKFASGNHFAFDLADIGFWYKEYARLMAHWKKTLPVSVHEVHYGDMVTEPEQTARALIEFCGLPWEEACLSFHESERKVQTASAWQVRQPIYTSSLERWRVYEKFLGPMKEALGDELLEGL